MRAKSPLHFVHDLRQKKKRNYVAILSFCHPSFLYPTACWACTDGKNDKAEI